MRKYASLLSLMEFWKHASCGCRQRTNSEIKRKTKTGTAHFCCCNWGSVRYLCSVDRETKWLRLMCCSGQRQSKKCNNSTLNTKFRTQVHLHNWERCKQLKILSLPKPNQEEKNRKCNNWWKYASLCSWLRSWKIVHGLKIQEAPCSATLIHQVWYSFFPAACNFTHLALEVCSPDGSCTSSTWGKSSAQWDWPVVVLWEKGELYAEVDISNETDLVLLVPPQLGQVHHHQVWVVARVAPGR